MGVDVAAGWDTMTGEQRRRWAQVLDHLADVVPSGASVVVDGTEDFAAVVADRLAATLHGAGRLGSTLPRTCRTAATERPDKATGMLPEANGALGRRHLIEEGRL